GPIVIHPEQMQMINPILILTLVPVMDSLIYPLIKKCGVNFTFINGMSKPLNISLAAVQFGIIDLYKYSIYSEIKKWKCQECITETVDIEPNSVHVPLQIPQYFLSTAGELVK
ncbi:hypothetical protein XENOCAPTIV_004053, partial [Xenoophorus captivus]